MLKEHKHKWAVMYDEKDGAINVFALCYADQEAGKGIITAEQLLRGDLPADVCRAALDRKEIEKRLNILERMAD